MKLYMLPLRSLALASVLLILPVMLAYSNIFKAEFTFDDGVTIFFNPAIKTLWPPSSLQHLLTSYDYVNQTNYTRPVAQFTFALNYALGGFTPWGYHAVNLAIHVGSTFLMFGILRRTLLTPLLAGMFGEVSLGVGLVGALLWGVHPLNTMDVTYTSPRMESLMAMFYLLTLYGWIRGVQARSRIWLALSVLSSFLGMMSKEVMVTAPVMVFLYDGMFLAGSWRQALRQRWRWYAGLALSIAWLVFLLSSVPGEHGALMTDATQPNKRGAHPDRWSYAATMPGVILYYLRLLAWPDPLVFDYKWPVAVTWSAVMLPGIAIAGALLAAIWGFLRRKAWAYPIAWYLIVLSPSSSVIPLYDDYIVEYRAYLPSVGPVALAVCCAWLVLRKAGWTPPRLASVGGLAGLVLVCVLGGLTWARNTVYRTEVSLWTDTVAKAPDNDRAHLCLANAFYNKGRYDEAIEEYRQALRLYPDNVVVHNNLGVVLAGQGRLEEALEEFRAILRVNPTDATAHGSVGVVLARQGLRDQALQEFRQTLYLNPNDALAEKNMRVLLGR